MCVRVCVCVSFLLRRGTLFTLVERGKPIVGVLSADPRAMIWLLVGKWGMGLGNRGGWFGVIRHLQIPSRRVLGEGYSSASDGRRVNTSARNREVSHG